LYRNIFELLLNYTNRFKNVNQMLITSSTDTPQVRRALAEWHVARRIARIKTLLKLPGLLAVKSDKAIREAIVA
jgi:hypothetical protein